jgi:hypothetical protein
VQDLLKLVGALTLIAVGLGTTCICVGAFTQPETRTSLPPAYYASQDATVPSTAMPELTEPRPPDPVEEMRRTGLRIRSGYERPNEIAIWRSGALPFRYTELIRDPSGHSGQRVWFQGRVLEIYDEGLRSYGRIATDGWDDPIWVECLVLAGHGVERDARVYVAGTLHGVRTYDSQAGWRITIPQVQAVAIILKADGDAAIRDFARSVRRGR